MGIRQDLAKAQEDARAAKEAKRLTRAEIVAFTKAIREMVRLESAVELAIELVRRAEEQ